MRALASSTVLVSIPIALAAACGPAAKGPEVPTATSSASAVATVTAPDEGAICDRVCAMQMRCGGDEKACRGRCVAAARVLLGSVTEEMVACVEAKMPKDCEGGEEGAKHRKQIVGDCTFGAIEKHEDDAKKNVALFAKTWCDGAASCGSPDATSASQCLGASQGAIMDQNADWVLYGSIRPNKVDDIVLCIKGAPCVERPTASDQVNKCVLDTLAKASEP